MPNKTLSEFLDRLDKTRERGDEWKACCPAHDDHDPSLSVREGDQYPVVVKCFAGCSYDEIARAVGMEPDAFSGKNGSGPTQTQTTEIPDSLSSDSIPEPVVSMSQVETWAENLAESTEVARSAREYLTCARRIPASIVKAAKIGLASSSQRVVEHWIIIPVIHPRHETCTALKCFGFDPQASQWAQMNGRKVCRNAGAGLLLYAPCDLPSYSDSPLVLCEGEIDALTALAEGYNAASGTIGASGFKSEWVRQIKNVEAARWHGVVICYDGDEQGEKGTHTAAEYLQGEGLPVSVARPPEGMDLNDMKASVKSIDSLIQDSIRYERWS